MNDSRSIGSNFCTIAIVIAFLLMAFLAVFRYISPDDWSLSDISEETVVAAEYVTNADGNTAYIEMRVVKGG